MLSGRAILRPLLGRKRFHGKGVNFLFHPVTERPVYQLVLLNLRFSLKFRTDDNCAEVIAVITFHMNKFARHRSFDMTFYAFRSNHFASFILILDPVVDRSFPV
ncbi:MAG: hypothetical protein BGO99_12370 [Nitrosospira sp. 56-18]|nr:MAG: hypothetical protein BGO99_12370 [Nitrosospira sp. 56-18]